jgi:hypothetical protein
MVREALVAIIKDHTTYMMKQTKKMFKSTEVSQ